MKNYRVTPTGESDVYVVSVGLSVGGRGVPYGSRLAVTAIDDILGVDQPLFAGTGVGSYQNPDGHVEVEPSHTWIVRLHPAHVGYVKNKLAIWCGRYKQTCVAFYRVSPELLYPVAD